LPTFLTLARTSLSAIFPERRNSGVTALSAKSWLFHQLRVIEDFADRFTERFEHLADCLSGLFPSMVFFASGFYWCHMFLLRN
jgi:hypothetical protein